MENKYIKIIKYYLKGGGKQMKSKNACGSRERERDVIQEKQKKEKVYIAKIDRYLYALQKLDKAKV